MRVPESRLGKVYYFTLAAILLSFVPILLAVWCDPFAWLLRDWFDVAEKGEALTFLGWATGGLMLFFNGLALGLRAQGQDRIAEAQHKTVRISTEANEQSIFEEGIKLLGHESPSARMGGLFTLHDLARNKPDRRRSVIEILCAHLRETTADDTYREDHKASPSNEIHSLFALLAGEDAGWVGDGRLDFHDAHLNGVELAHARMRGANLQGASLREAKLSHAELRGANMSGIDLEDGILVDARLEEANLWRANLGGAELGRAQLLDANLTEARLEKTSFVEAKLERASFVESHGKGANFVYAELQGANFDRAEMQGAFFAGAALQKAHFLGANLQAVTSNSAKMEGARLMGADLRMANLSGAELSGAGLSEASLEGADLAEADLRGAAMQGTRLQGSDLSWAKLQGAHLQGAHLQGACLQGVNLHGANLENARMHGADLTEAKLQGAYMFRTQLQGADLVRAQLQGALLLQTQLQGAILKDALLQGADLGRAGFQEASLAGAQLQGAFSGEGSPGLPDGSFGDRISKRVGEDTELNTAVFHGGATGQRAGRMAAALMEERQWLDEEGAERLEAIAESLANHVDLPAGHEPPDDAETGELDEKAVKEIIEEYDEAMQGSSPQDNPAHQPPPAE